MYLKVKASPEEGAVAVPAALMQALQARDGDTVVVEPTPGGFVVVSDPASVACQLEVGEAVMARYADTLADLA